jgi:anaerobic magnesium-protoporphyrin IX monomethyl ester cyclase
MIKILFINPVIRQNENPAHVPYGMAQLVAIAIKEGHNVQVFDANAWRPTLGQVKGVLTADTWDVIAIGGLVTTYGYIKRMVTLARKLNPNALIVAGGGFITPIPYDVMTFLPEIDLGVIGEAYLTLPEILTSIESKTYDWKKIKGIIFRDKDGALHLTEERPLLQDIDLLPFPAWDMFPLDIYFGNSSLLLSEEAMLSKKHIGIIASYGCPYKCKFCFHLGLSGELRVVKNGSMRNVEITSRRKVRYHSPAYIVELVNHAKSKFGIDFVSFLDENFAILGKKKDWFSEFTELWFKYGLQPSCIEQGKTHHPDYCEGIHWGTTAHAAVVNSDLLTKFKRLGCAHLDYGLESFSDPILTSIEKGSNASQNERAVEMTLSSGIRPIPNQIIGFPDESFDSILANIDAWERLGIKSYPFFATPYPGSEWYTTYKDKILEQYDGNLENFLLDLGDATKITAVISKNFNAVELIGLRELMVAQDKRRIRDYKKIYEKRYVNC